MEPSSRRMWRLVEPIHAVTYFAPEALDALARAGYRGFWMGYFAGRLAPLGPVGPQVATAVCFGFAPSRVARALPDAWSFATPEDALEARLSGATATLRRVGGATPGLEAAADLIWEAAASTRPPQVECWPRPTRCLPRPDDPMGAMWQAATTLREHRGDGHNAALVAAGVTPVQAHWLKIAAGESEDQTLAASRGWPDETWEHGRRELQVRGWLDPEGRLTSEGRTARAGDRGPDGHRRRVPVGTPRPEQDRHTRRSPDTADRRGPAIRDPSVPQPDRPFLTCPVARRASAPWRRHTSASGSATRRSWSTS